jgi:hypothetical protein
MEIEFYQSRLNHVERFTIFAQRCLFVYHVVELAAHFATIDLTTRPYDVAMPVGYRLGYGNKATGEIDLQIDAIGPFESIKPYPAPASRRT